MGVDIKEIISSKIISLNELENKTLAIDAYNALYQFLSIIREKTGEPLRDSKGNVTSHLSGLYYRTINLRSMGIKPVYIFDGVPPEIKSSEIARRRSIKEEAKIKYTIALKRGRIEEAQKYAKYTSYLTNQMVNEAKNLLNFLGVPWVQAPSEGEATAAHLSSTGKVYAAASQDYDVLLFGGKRLCRNITISGKRKLPRKHLYQEIEPEEFLLDKILSELQITREQLIDIGILVGTDFNPDGFRGFGPIKALKAIKQYGSLEKLSEIQDELKKINHNIIREIFLKPKVEGNVDIRFKPTNEEGLLDFLCGKYEFSEERILNALNKYKQVEQEKKKQGFSLDKWL
jgi:flap endonuclease-1